jgi:integrase
LLTGLRAGEVAGLTRAEIEHLDDPERAALTIRGERTKNGRDHYVPLSLRSAATIREAIQLTGDDDRVIGCEGHALAVAMRRMTDKLLDEPGADTWRADPLTPHDLRRTTATRLSALGVPSEDVSAVLNHVRADVTGKHYDQYDRTREKRIALTAWSAALARILDPKAGDVVPIHKGRARQ